MVKKLIDDQFIDSKIRVPLKRKRTLTRLQKNKSKQQNVEQILNHPRDRLKRHNNNVIRSKTNFPIIDFTKTSPNKYLKNLQRGIRKRKGMQDTISNKIRALKPPEVEFITESQFLKEIQQKKKTKKKKNRREKSRKLRNTKYDINQLEFKDKKHSYLKYPKIVASEEFLKEVPEFNY